MYNRHTLLTLNIYFIPSSVQLFTLFFPYLSYSFSFYPLLHLRTACTFNHCRKPYILHLSFSFSLLFLRHNPQFVFSFFSLSFSFTLVLLIVLLSSSLSFERSDLSFCLSHRTSFVLKHTD